MKFNIKINEVIEELELHEIIGRLSTGEPVALEVNSETQLVGVNIVNAAGNVKPYEVTQAMAPHATVFNSTHQTINPDSGLNQFSYRLIYALDKQVSVGDAQFIESELVTSVLNAFPDIDLHHGMVTGLNTGGYMKGAGKPGEVLTGEFELLNADDYALRRKAERELKELMESTKKMNKTNAAIPKELIDMAKHLCKKGITDEEFAKIALGVWNSQLNNEYSEDEAMEVLQELDNRGHEDSYYLAFKPASSEYEGSKVTVATLIWTATNNGYKRGYMERFYVEDATCHVIPTDTIVIEKHINEEGKVEQYINEEDIYVLLKSDAMNILIDSPTGSGKTSATINAVRRMLDEDENLYAYFAMPTQGLTIQTAVNKKIGKPLYGRESAKMILKSNMKTTGRKIVTGTYDKTPRFMETIKNIPGAKVIIIADEAHKEISDYFFRKPAIKGLFDLREHQQVKKFIGLSGTPQQIDKEVYDTMTVFEQRNAKPIFNQMKVVDYSKSLDYTKVISELIAKEVKEGRKVLTFILNTIAITEVADVLRGMGIKVATVMSKPGNEAMSQTYCHLMDEQAFPKGVDVILATNAIADGINIINENEQYTCIVASHYSMSPMFDLSLIKQMTNRFRNQYDRLIVPLFIKEDLEQERKDQTALYGLEDRYQVLWEKAERIASYVKKRFSGKLNEYKPSVLESLNGMFYVNSHYQDKNNFGKSQNAYITHALELERHFKANPERSLIRHELEKMEKLDEIRAQLFSIDKRTIRKTASRDAEKYYENFPYAFISGLEDILETKAVLESAVAHLEDLDKDVSQQVERHLAELEETKKETEKEKHEKIEEILTEKVFEEIKTDYFKRGRRILEDGKVWNVLNETMNKRDLKVLKDVLPFTDFDSALKIAKGTKHSTKTFLFRRALKAVDELEGFKKTEESSATQVMFNEITRKFGEADYVTANGKQCLTKGQMDTMWSEVAGSLNETAKTVENLYKRFYVCDNSPQKVKGVKNSKRVYYDFRTINPTDIGRIYGIEFEAMQSIYAQFKDEMYDDVA